MVYASVWDFRFNHIPLARHYPFTYGGGGPGSGLHGDALMTRKAGWGQDGAMYGGAPFDAAGGGLGSGGIAPGGISLANGSGDIPLRPVPVHNTENIV